MELRAELVQELQLSAESDAQPTEDAPGGAAGAGDANNAVSVAAIVSVQSNKAHAIVDAGAELDALRALRVIASVIYPYLTRPDEYIPLTGSELTDKLKNEGYDAVNNYLDGARHQVDALQRVGAQHGQGRGARHRRLGQRARLRPTSPRRSSSPGAKLNQDPFYRPDHDDPADNDNVTHSANANNVDEHVVSDRGHELHAVARRHRRLQLHAADGHDHARRSVDYDKELDLSPLGGASKRGGVGGAILLSILDNTTHAIVGDGVDVYSGKRSGLNLKAEEAIFQFDFSQSGATAASTRSRARSPTSGRTATSSPRSRAASTSPAAASTSTPAASRRRSPGSARSPRATALGVGPRASASTTSTARRGRSSATIPTRRRPAAASTIDVAGDVDVYAKVDGELWAFTVAGTLVSPAPPDAADPNEPDRQAQSSIPAAAAAAGQTGIGIAGAVSIHQRRRHGRRRSTSTPARSRPTTCSSPPPTTPASSRPPAARRSWSRSARATRPSPARSASTSSR